jgi:alkyl sulfatase BDS1-like metallo-beta-lactamase superfamily hydrolase
VDVLSLADRLWNGDIPIEDLHPISFSGDLAEVARGVAFLPSFANVTVVKHDGGLALIDTGSPMFAASNFDKIRAWSTEPVSTAVYTHGHIDHVFGLGPFEKEAADAGWPAPHVVGHSAIPPRFDRYRSTAGYNAVINRRQFQIESLEWPTDYRYPDQLYDDQLSLDVGGTTMELRHGRGETDDATWVWMPDRDILCCGDFFIWASPNAGNPQKVQRYPAEWAAALRTMAAHEAAILLPGHGLPVIGRARVRQVLEDSASLLESLVEQSLTLINEGATLDEVMHSVSPPSELLERPYLRPIYDEPEFIVRNVWRLYAGWYSGDPSELKPAPKNALATELATLAGGAAALATRAEALAGAGKLRLASHLVELALHAAPDDPEIRAANQRVYARRAEDEASTMSKGIFSWAASRAKE